jgi:hypothetical protein
MALFIRQDEQRTKLQERVAAELQERAKQRAVSTTAPDGVDDSRYVEHTKNTGSLAWVWVVLFIIVIVGFVLFVVLKTTQK